MESLYTLLERAAESAPDKPLIVDKRTLSYGEAARRTAAMGVALAEAGVAAGDRVAVLLPDGPELVLALYGVMSAGAAAVPLSSDARAPSLWRLLARCDARAVITTGKNTALLAGATADLPALRLVVSLGAPRLEDEGQVRVRRFEELAPLDATGATPRRAGRDDLASIMFTSGTTGEPKGVMLSHANLLAANEAIIAYLALRSDERHALVLPLFYSYGLSVLHTHIGVGATLVVAGSVAYPAAVLRAIEQHRCTGLSGVPSTFAHLLQSSAFAKYDLSSLRYLTQAGGPMTPALTRAVRERLPQAELFVMYGQTEAGPRLTYLAPADLERKLGTVGKAMPGVEVRVVTAGGSDAAPGEVGELWARGPSIMQGYCRDPAATAQALAGGWLHTGDLARADDEGYLSIVGRNSDMIKAGAHRIGPQEIEHVIDTLEAVAQSAVVGVPDALEGEAIAAFVVPRAGAAVDEQMVRRVCHEHLPRFKLPAHVRIVTELPYTANGKLERAALLRRFVAETARALEENV